MKLIATAAIAAAIAVVASPALAADSMPQINWYGNLGYSAADFGDATLNNIDARFGGRTAHLGVEGEVATGLGDKTVSGVKVKVNSSYALYGVGWLPVDEHTDVFARVGFGHDDLRASLGGVSTTTGRGTWNYGAGIQYAWGANGVRADYTYHDLQNGGGHANVYGLAYVRKF